MTRNLAHDLQYVSHAMPTPPSLFPLLLCRRAVTLVAYVTSERPTDRLPVYGWAEVLGGDRGLRPNPGHYSWPLALGAALDVEVGQDAVEPARQPPVAGALDNLSRNRSPPRWRALGWNHWSGTLDGDLG